LIPDLLQPPHSETAAFAAVPVCIFRVGVRWTTVPINPKSKRPEQGAQVQVLVRDNNVDQALKALKKKMQREGIFREMKLRGHFEKPSEKKAREKAEAIRRARKLARKKLQREGLLPMKPKPAFGAAAGGRGGPGRGGPGAGAPRSGGFGGGR